MTEPQPLVCVFLKLPPSHRPVSRIYEIAWDVFLPQLNRLNSAFEAAQATHPSPKAKKIWSEARQAAAKKMGKLQDVSFTNYTTASGFLGFLNALQKGRFISEAHREFQAAARQAVRKAGIAQEVMIEFREDLRIAVSRITAIMSSDDEDVSSLTTESSQSMLELATAVEECGAILEEYRDEFTEVQRQSFDEKDNSPSDEEFKMVQEKWQAFYEIADRLKYGWESLKDEMRGLEESQEPGESGEPATTSPENPTSSKTPKNSSKSHKVPFWRKLFRRISSCLRLETIC